MTKSLAFGIALGLSVFLTTSAVPSPEDAVASSYPAELTAIANKYHYHESRQQAFVAVTITGREYIVAAYSNGKVGAVALLERTAAGVVARQVIRDHQTGKSPEVSAVDLDGDGRSEVIVMFDVGRGANESWIYRIGDGGLALMSPTEKHGGSVLSDPDILDLAGDGSMDLVDKEAEGRGDDAVITWHHLVLRNGSYVDAAALDFYEVFYRDSGAPKTHSERFSIPASSISKPYRLTVINGWQLGKDYRVASGTIQLNGAVISSPSDFGQTRASWTVPVTLQADNVITVRLEGKPQSRIAVAIRHD